MQRKIKSSKNNRRPVSCAMNQLFQISRKHSRGDDSGGMERQAASGREKNRTTTEINLQPAVVWFGTAAGWAVRREASLFACLARVMEFQMATGALSTPLFK
jgi:hypothetical protein